MNVTSNFIYTQEISILNILKDANQMIDFKIDRKKWSANQKAINDILNFILKGY